MQYVTLMLDVYVTKFITLSVAVSKMELVVIKHMSESHWIVLLGYLTILTNVRCYYRVVYNDFVFEQDSAPDTRCTLNSTQSNCCSAKFSTSFLMSYGPITAQSLTPLTVRFRESHSSTSMSCKQ